MTITDTHLFIAFIISGIVAIGIIALATTTAPTFDVGVERVRFGMKIVLRAVVALGLIIGAGMLGWGVFSRDEGLMYFSMMPLAGAILTSNFMQRSGIR